LYGKHAPGRVLRVRAYLRESNALASETERARRNLLDRLLSGHPPGAEEERRAETLGLRSEGDHAVIAAVVALEAGDEESGLIARALAHEEPAQPFVVARHDEVVAVLPVYVRRGPRDLAATIERAAAPLQRSHGVRLRAGVSSVCSGLADLARGYGEAHRALRHVDTGGGVVALEALSLTEYLAAGADETARRLVSPGIDTLCVRTGARAAPCPRRCGPTRTATSTSGAPHPG
jgi:hypothetical protein